MEKDEKEKLAEAANEAAMVDEAQDANADAVTADVAAAEAAENAGEAAAEADAADAAAVDADDEAYATFLRDNLGEAYDEADEKKNRKGLMDYVNRNKEGTARLTEAMKKEPRFAQVLIDIANGKRGAHAALARYFGKDFLTAEEGTPEYDEIMAAEDERLAEMEASAKARDDYKANFEASVPVIEAFCKEKAYDYDDFREKIWNEVALPIMEGRYTREFLELLDKAMSYDKDVKDAFAAGEVKGGNANINGLKRNREVPSVVTGGGAPINSKPKKAKMGGLLGEATSFD